MTVLLGGAHQVYWIYPASLTMFFLTSTRVAYLYVLLMCALIIPTLQASLTTLEFINIFVALFGTTFFINVFANEIKSENRNLDLLATQDFLTKSGNRRAFDHALEMTLKESVILNTPSCLIVIDIDNFKLLNDNHGHSVGDAVLKHLVKSAQTVLRKTDTVYRIGGEEFAILMEDASLDDARGLAEKIRQTIEADSAKATPYYTISLGIAALVSGENGCDWLNRADKAMYEAKRSGKNRVVANT
ncbi:GGDEF domain-containing protein [Alteromonas halophila]|nr:GGDEF domain-containing protein [Alteromonas halophila]